MKETKYAGTQTEKNLMAAFAGESEARNKIGPQKREPSMPFPSGIASSQRGIGPVKLMLQCFGGSISVLLTYSILFSP